MTLNISPPNDVATAICRVCGVPKPMSQFRMTNFKGGTWRRHICVACLRQRCHAHEITNNRMKYGTNRNPGMLARLRERNKVKREQTLHVVIAAYGSKCECCSEGRPEMLTFDHVNGGGYHGPSKTWVLRSRIIHLGFPKEYRVLCYNCNSAIGLFGYCPHVDDSKYKMNTDSSSSRIVREYRQAKLDVIVHYGGECEICGETYPEFLTIDHINGGGRKEKVRLGGTWALYRKLRSLGYPKDNYRLLCWNCNCSRLRESAPQLKTTVRISD